MLLASALLLVTFGKPEKISIFSLNIQSNLIMWLSRWAVHVTRVISLFVDHLAIKNKMLKAKYHNSLTVTVHLMCIPGVVGILFLFFIFLFRGRGIITVDIKVRGNAMTFSG